MELSGWNREVLVHIWSPKAVITDQTLLQYMVLCGSKSLYRALHVWQIDYDGPHKKMDVLTPIFQSQSLKLRN